MIKYVDWNKLVSSVADQYTTYANNIARDRANGKLRRSKELRFIVLTRYVKELDLQIVKEDAVQLSTGVKGYDESVIKYTLTRINTILGSTFNVPIVYNAQLDS